MLNLRPTFNDYHYQALGAYRYLRDEPSEASLARGMLQESLNQPAGDISGIENYRHIDGNYGLFFRLEPDSVTTLVERATEAKLSPQRYARLAIVGSLEEAIVQIPEIKYLIALRSEVQGRLAPK